MEIRKKRQIAGSKGGKFKSRWTDVERKKGNQLYVLLFNKDDEIFVKVGITEISIASRYSVPNGYNIKTIYQYMVKDAVSEESYLGEILEIHRYIPNKKFGGYLECYELDSLKIIKEYMTDKGISPIINFNKTITELQANQKQTTSYKDKDKEEDKEKNKIYRKFKHLSLSEKEFENLKKKGLTKQQIDSYCDAIENYAKNKNYNSLNLTIQTWWRRDKKNNPSDVDNGIGGM